MAVESEEIRRALQEVDVEAADHGANYGAGMREARRILEQRLLGGSNDGR